MSVFKLMLLYGTIILSGCDQSSTSNNTPPTQVVYRFDDHRYLELTGFGCIGALWYTDVKMKIHTEVTSQFYQLFTSTYIHPSERYIAIGYYDNSGFLISKDYGRTWERASYSPGGGAIPGGSSNPSSGEIESFTVINDQAFILTKKGELYLSSKPFGERWGKDYVSLRAIEDQRYGYKMTFSEAKNFQDLPHQIPEVKNYIGWDHMRCDPNLGSSSIEDKK
ncbi:hypothetical protein C5Y41_20585 [Rahnella variigena]|uniref:T6SS immunity protein Tli3 family protein n=1 Tax=Rahnella variigena TaxID=574964 RepID=UPI00101C402F|nr:hypothetical protein [Rahnella variigena]RYJ11910.1 hypothetical protein C5Y41_20585 [Rahnella variigena]